ncbi:lethal(3)malignant brain tumor-like protein 4 isoform X3 [Brienomyrus brachyistius]|uniref:lethal(3)malignant brain tumor-like protein 4 isoform X3 n=1 Tax=Brienomyrus brachyistius TaxID=42636 RepID=UPI0020B45A18|nr:lethal(3)malignant brain tumor-like protein 4 isoform X3 [Brienomyrus brachyistius]
MQGDERKKKRLAVTPRGGALDEYYLRERRNEDEVKMKSKVSASSAVNTKKKLWSWDQYLEEEKMAMAPVRLFTEEQSLPQNRNGFKAGMRLEGIDPLHPSMFCVLSVAEVIGYRLRLHFDGYPECYDFWVNADSPDIRPAGWCETTGRKLHPPKGYKDEGFSWEQYEQTCDVLVAPKTLFKKQTTTESISGFQVGMKLEAVDRKNPCLVCVASIADIIDQRFLVHFDNWDDTYDYWCDPSSPHVHPVGWCQERGRPLTAPQGYPSPENFRWEEYLEDTGATAVPSHAFSLRAPHRFLQNMKLEAVDKRNPMLIRVATIVDVEDYRVKVHFDGWPHKFDFWVDSDYPDLHPAGWCARTGHPLETPPRPSDLKPSSNQGVCPTPGCRGVGHIKGARYTGHHRLTQPAKYLKIKEEEEDIDVQSLLRECGVDGMQQTLHQSIFLSAMTAHPSRELPLCWEQHCKLLPGVVGVPASRVALWTVDEVTNFIHSLPGCEEPSKQFQDEQIDGKAFLLLTQHDIVKIMSVKLGPALKIYNSILMFKHAEEAQSGGHDTST